MPFKVDAAKSRINRLVWSFNGEKLVLKYNAGEKYAKLQEKVDEDGQLLDREDENGRPVEQSIAEIRMRTAEALCMVIEEWDVEDENGVVPINAKAVAGLGLPLEFYNGLSTAISEDFQSRGGGTKSSR